MFNNQTFSITWHSHLMQKGWYVVGICNQGNCLKLHSKNVLELPQWPEEFYEKGDLSRGLWKTTFELNNKSFE